MKHKAVSLNRSKMPRKVIKVLVKRDSTENFNTTAFTPRKYELTAAYETESNKIIYKMGDGKTPWAELPEVTTINEIDRFKVYSDRKDVVEVFFNPQSIKEFLNENDGSNKNETG